MNIFQMQQDQPQKTCSLLSFPCWHLIYSVLCVLPTDMCFQSFQKHHWTHITMPSGLTVWTTNH